MTATRTRFAFGVAGGQKVAGGMTVTRTHFAFRIDMWDSNGDLVVEHLAGAEDYLVALATYRAACERWPGGIITLRQGARVIHDSRKSRLRGARGRIAPLRRGAQLGPRQPSMGKLRSICPNLKSTVS
jgi:hypothetical protein